MRRTCGIARKVLLADEIIEMLSREISPLVASARSRSARARHRISHTPMAADAWVSSRPSASPFCLNCNRLRLTSDGKLRYCLFAIEEDDVKDLLRSGAPDEEIAALIRRNIAGKWLGHEINSAKFVAAAAADVFDRRLITRSARFSFLLTLLAAIAAAQTLVLDDVNLIDGSGAPAKPHMRVVIRGEQIQSVEPSAGPLPGGAVLWKLHGMTVIPGLIDAHVHLTTGAGNTAQIEQTLRFGLLGGVTSVRDMAGDDIVLAELAKRFHAATEAGPRIYFSTLVAGPQFFNDPRTKSSAHGGVAGEVAWMRAVDEHSDIPAIVAAGKATGATGLKIYADLPASIVDRLVAEAHRQGLRVWSHSAIFPAKPGEVVQAGVDVVSHSVYLGDEGMNPPLASYELARRGLGIDYAATPVEGDAIAHLLQLMKDKGTILDETLFVTNAGKRGDDDPVWRWTIAVTRRAHQIGVRLAAGTDSFGNPTRDAAPNIHEEMRLLVEKCGLTPLEAIEAATEGAARAIGIEKSYGMVEAGKTADLVILRDDPSTDIAKTKNIAAVIKGGVAYQR